MSIAGLGAGLFWLLDMPLPFLFGPLASCLIAALLGVELKGLSTVSAGARTILGVAVGASLTRAVIDQIPEMALSVALVPIYILIIGVIGFPYFHKIAKFDRPTAYYAAMPGGLQDMVQFGKEAGGDVRALSLIHATRVLCILIAMPFVLTHFFGATLDHPIGAPAAELPVHEMVIMALAAILGWRGAVLIGLFGASILGPMIVSAALSLGDIIHSRPPAEAILIAQFFIGMGIGSHYSGITLSEVRKFVISGAVYSVLLALIGAVFATIVVRLGLAPSLEGILAFAPGGQAEMTVLAIIVGADLGYVIVHHLTRIVLVISCAPITAKLLLRNTKGPRAD